MSTLGVILGVIVLVAIALVFIYNRLVALRQTTNQAWGDVDVQLTQRHELVPNLVETVKGYAAHEKETLEAVIAARNAAVAAGSVQEQADAENMLTGALRQIFALSEAYPDLKANQNFGRLQEELTSTENRISFARQHYNGAVTEYNMARQTFPSSIVANMFGFAAKEFFELEEPEAREAPKVSFT